jgi:hypothetical protein
MREITMSDQPRYAFGEIARGSDDDQEAMYRAVEAAVEAYCSSASRGDGDLREHKKSAALCLMNLTDILVSEINDPTFVDADDLRRDLASGVVRLHPGPRCYACGKPLK